MKRALLLLLLIFCVAPTPGEVAGCGDASIVADAQDFCIQSRAWDCRRQEARGEIEDIQGCVDPIPASCEGVNWQPQCSPYPTNMETQACIDNLGLAEHVFADGNGDGVYAISEVPFCDLCGLHGGE